MSRTPGDVPAVPSGHPPADEAGQTRIFTAVVVVEIVVVLLLWAFGRYFGG